MILAFAEPRLCVCVYACLCVYINVLLCVCVLVIRKELHVFNECCSLCMTMCVYLMFHIKIESIVSHCDAVELVECELQLLLLLSIHTQFINRSFLSPIISLILSFISHLIDSPHTPYGRKALDAALEHLHGFYRTAHMLWQCEDHGDWHSMTTITSLEQHWPQVKWAWSTGCGQSVEGV